MTSKFLLVCISFFCCLFFTSCMSVGNQFSSSVSWIKTHKTRRAEIENAFGPPYRTGYDSGFLTYSYGFYKYSAFSDSQTKDLTIRFDKNNLVESYSFSSSFPEDKKIQSQLKSDE